MSAVDKGTPGPWAWNGDYGESQLSGPGGQTVLDTDYDGMLWLGSDDDVRDAANARLIAAAPELYESLSGLVGLCALLLANDLPPNVRAALETNHRIVAARAALAKVETP